jgi:dipeptidyl aminopeptidase/acylaminoacyl peptidase
MAHLESNARAGRTRREIEGLAASVRLVEWPAPPYPPGWRSRSARAKSGPMKRMWLTLSLALIACGSTSTSSTGTGPTGSAGGGQPTAPQVATPPGNPSSSLIPREIFFGNPERASVRISPSGKMLSWLAPVDGVLNVWVAPVGKLEQARSITADTTRPVRIYFWAYDGKHILYQQDTGGDEDWHVFSVNVATGKTIDLTPMDKVAARVLAVSHKAPGKVMIGVNDRTPQLHDVYEVDIATGNRKLVVENEGYLGFSFDHDLRPRLAMAMSPDGGMVVKKAVQKGKAPLAWDDFLTIPQDDSLTTQPLGFDRTGRYLYMLDSRDRDTAALRVVSVAQGAGKVVAEDPRADISGILTHPTQMHVEAVSFTYDRETWKVLDKKIAPDFEQLKRLPGEEFSVTSRTLDDRTWIVAATSDTGPVRYYLWDRRKKKETFLFSNRPALEDLELAPMRPVVIKARDGLDLVSYLTLPTGSDSNADGTPDSPQKMVLLVHGGPWGRDSWGFDPIHQLLANRGYATLSVNFRGSTGFGKKFINAGDREWAGKMHDDLIDAVNWAVQGGVADRSKVCIMGGSYGGYATLVGLTFTPDVFACGVDIVGPSSIITLLSTIPPYWAPLVSLFKTRVGDWTTEEGKKDLLARSPLTRVDKIKRPLLIGQGANDPRVKQSESDQIVKAMQDKGIPVTYVLFPDEGHGFARQDNSLAFWAVTEAFLSAYLGGQFQPLEPGAFQGSSITVPVGAEAVPQLRGALPAR